MKVLVIGSGGREHALCWKLAQSPLCSEVICAPGNPGIGQVARCVPIKGEDIPALLDLAVSEGVGLAVIGPEAFLVTGLADVFRQAGIPTFGPGQQAAQLENSKAFMKDVVSKAGVPTAAYASFDNPEDAEAYIRSQTGGLAVKTDGLAAGKGVILCPTPKDALNAVDLLMRERAFGDAGKRIVIEEFLVGEEVSFFALCDGVTSVPMVGVQDHKAVGDGDTGPNTGGMGAYSPAPIFTPALRDEVMETMIQPTLKAMAEMGAPFQGVLFAGLMITATGPKLIEYNIRFGDPECQVMMMLLESDLLPVLLSAAQGTLSDVSLKWSDESALLVVMAADGYPGTPKTGTEIRDLDRAAAIDGVQIFHAGTKSGSNGELLSAGGRVLGVGARAPSLAEAQKRAYQAVDAIDWPEGFCRRDIGWRAL